MQMEARSFSQDKSQQLLRKVKDYQADLRKISDDFKQAQGGGGGGAAARAELGLSDNYYDTSAGGRWGQGRALGEAGRQLQQGCRRVGLALGRQGAAQEAEGRRKGPIMAAGLSSGAQLNLSYQHHYAASASCHLSIVAAWTLCL